MIVTTASVCILDTSLCLSQTKCSIFLTLTRLTLFACHCPPLARHSSTLFLSNRKHIEERTECSLERLTKPHFSSKPVERLDHPYGRELSNGHRTLS